MDLPLLEDDLGRPGVLEAHMMHRGAARVAPVAVLCFFNDLLDDLAAEGSLRRVYTLRSEIGQNPVYEYDTGRGRGHRGPPRGGGALGRGLRRGARRPGGARPSSPAGARARSWTTWTWVT